MSYIISVIFPGDEEKANFVENNFIIKDKDRVANSKQTRLLWVYTVDSNEEKILEFEEKFKVSKKNVSEGDDFDADFEL